MNLPEATKSALLSLRLNPLRSLLTMLGVIIGVGIIVLLIGIGEGLKVFVQHELTTFGTNLLAVTPGKFESQGGNGTPGLTTEKKLSYEDVEYLRRRMPLNVTALAPNTMSASEVRAEGRSRDTIVMGTSFDHPDCVMMPVARGRFFTQAEERAARRVCCVGATIVREVFHNENPLGQVLRIGDARFRVIGVMEKKGLFFGFDMDDLVLIPITAAMRVHDLDEIQKLNIRVRDGADPNQVLEQVRAILIDRHDGREDFTIMSQASMLETMDEILSGLTVVLGFLAGVSLVVGGIGIMNIMLVSVKERTREIGIRKAVGARRLDILAQFMVEAIVVCLLGGGLGMLGSIGILYGVSHAVEGFPAMPPLWAILLGLGFSTGVGMVFGVYPALQASRLKVVDALRSV